MGKILTDKINTFFGGKADDVRIQDLSFSDVIQHFDIFTYPKRLVPFRAMEADQDTTFKIKNFLSTNSQLYGLGEQSGLARVKIYEKSGGIITGSWTASTNGQSNAQLYQKEELLHYKNFLFGINGTYIFGWGDITGTPTFTTTALNIGSHTNRAQGLVTRDELLLIPYDNKIAKKDGGSTASDNWDATALTLSDQYIITDIIEYGDLVAIATKPVDRGLTSKVWLWDKIADDVVDVIDFGEGDLQIIANINNQIVGLSQVGGASATAIKAKFVVSRWVGGTSAKVEQEVEADDLTVTIYGNDVKAIDGNKIVFGMKIKLQGTTYSQLFVVGRKSTKYPLALAGHILIDNDTPLTDAIDGLFKLGNYFFVAHNANGSVNRTNDQAVYTATSVYISQKIDGSKFGNFAHKNKSLKMAGLEMDPLPSGGSASLYYRKNEDTAWTLIFTETTQNKISREAGVDNADADFDNFKELQFKVESTGNAQPTGIVFSMQVLGDDAIEEN